MAKLDNFTASMEMPSGMKPSGNNTFPLVQAHDILVGYDENNQEVRLDDKLDNIGNGVDIIDVLELPTEDINKSAIYRLAHPMGEVYVRTTNMAFKCGTLKEYLAFLLLIDCTIDVQIVETLPDSLELSVIENGGTLFVYIVKSTGVPYFDKGQGTMTIGKYLNQLDSTNKGWSTDINSETGGGVYCVDCTTYTYHIYKESGLVEFANAEYVNAAIAKALTDGKGFIENIKTIDGSTMRFFVGTEEEYIALPSEDRENLFAIITDDTTKSEMTEAIEDLLSWKNQQKVYTYEFDEGANVFSDNIFYFIADLPDGKTVDDIISIGLSTDFTISTPEHEGTINYSKLTTQPLGFSASRLWETFKTQGKTSTTFHLNTTTTISTAEGLFGDWDDVFIAVSLDVEVYSQGGGLYAKFKNSSYTLVNSNGVVVDNLTQKKLGTGSFELYHITFVFA